MEPNSAQDQCSHSATASAQYCPSCDDGYGNIHSRPATEEQVQGPNNNVDDSVRHLEFVVVTLAGADNSGHKRQSALVRTQAMRDVWWRRQHPQSSQMEATATDTQATNLSGLKGRFRLRPQSQNSKPVKARRKREFGSTGRGAWEDELSSQSLVYLPTSIGSPSAPLSSHGLNFAPGTMRIVQYYHQGYKTNFRALDVDNTKLFTYASENLGLFHAILYAAGVDRNLRCATEDRESLLIHSTAAIRIINERICEQDCSDETIEAVAKMSIAEVLSGRFYTARAHMDGLKAMVDMRGGIRNIRPITSRVLTWADFYYSTASSSPLKFDRIVDKKVQEVDESVVIDSDVQLFRAVSQLLRSLRPLSSIEDGQELSKQIYAIEYELHDLTNCYQYPSDGTENTYIGNSLFYAIHLYIYVVIRELPSQSHLVKILVHRLHIALEMQWKYWVSSIGELRHWLAWTLSVGYVSATDDHNRHWFMEKLKPLYASYNIQSALQFQSYLQGIAWDESWHGPCYKQLLCTLAGLD